jgi:hypothetical protein
MGERKEGNSGGQRKEEKETQRWWTPAFSLVVIMLIVFAFLIVVVLYIPGPDTKSFVPDTTSFNTNASDMYSDMYSDALDYRKNILAVIVTVFGAWIGAGAAYHFGRENMKEATSSMLQMREPSAKERLRRTPIREMPLKPLDWRVKTSDLVKDVMDKLKENPKLWFIPIVGKDGKVETIINEEAIWRFVMEDKETPKADEPSAAVVDNVDKTVNDVLVYIRSKDELKRFEDIYLRVTLDGSAGDAYEQMQSKGAPLAAVADETGNLTHYFTTGDVRRVLLQGD